MVVNGSGQLIIQILFKIVGADYLGLLYEKSKGKKDLTAYILSFSYNVSRVIHLKLVSNLSTTEFVKSFK